MRIAQKDSFGSKAVRGETMLTESSNFWVLNNLTSKREVFIIRGHAKESCGHCARGEHRRNFHLRL